MKAIAFIFARGGSKGLPGKNIKELCGKPMIAYSIQAAQSVKEIERVFVSTDDLKIAEVAKEYGAEIIARPEELATDTASEWLSWQHASAFVKDKYGEFDCFISLPATSPLRNKRDVENALTTYSSSNADICIGCTPASRSPYFNMVKKNQNGFVELMCTSEGSVSRRQDAPMAYDITTVAYVTSPSFIAHNEGLFSGSVSMFEVPKERSVDIDDIYDFIFAESILKGVEGNG